MITRFLTLSCTLLSVLPHLSPAEILVPDDLDEHFQIAADREEGAEDFSRPSDPIGTDVLRFLNGDIIHGQFAGMKNGILWSRADAAGEIRFQLKNLRQVIFEGGRNEPGAPLLPYLSLANGDVIPGDIISLDDKNFVLESPLTGRLTIPREQVRSFTPNPFGGQLLYAGPFTSDRWLMVEQKMPKPSEGAAEDAEKAGAEDSEEAVAKRPDSWLYSGAAFYSKNNRPLALDAGLPDVGRLRFTLGWQNRLSATVAFHADYRHSEPLAVSVTEKKPAAPGEGEDEAAEEEKGDAKPDLEPLAYESLFDLRKGDAFQSVGWLPTNSSGTFLQTYGSSYVLTFNSNFVTLHHNIYDAEGRPVQQSRRGAQISGERFVESGEAEFDLRFDRKKKFIYLYVNGRYATQWNEMDTGYAGKGGGIGFCATGNSKIKVSDIIVSSWSGTPDAARSLEHDERDIALLTNGTDRFSGKVTAIADGKVMITGPYAEMAIPLEELAEVHLQRSGIAQPDAVLWPPESAMLVFNPIGRLTLVPAIADQTSLRGTSPVLGDIKVDLTSATLLQFADSPEALREWVTDF